MDIKALIGITLGLGVSLGLMYGRKKIRFSIRFSIALFGLLFGVYGLITTEVYKKSDLMVYWGLFSIGIYFILDRLLFTLSWKLQQRDFTLWLRGSNEIKDYERNLHANWVDKVLSVLSLFFIILFMGLGTHLFRLK